MAPHGNPEYVARGRSITGARNTTTISRVQFRRAGANSEGEVRLPYEPTAGSRPPPIVNTTLLNHRTRHTAIQPAPFTPARSSYDPSAPTSTRKVSASFSTHCPLSGHPTIAYSAVTASIMMNHPGHQSSHAANSSSALSSSNPYRNMDTSMTYSALKPSNTYSNLPMPTAEYKALSSKPSVATAYTTTRALPSRNVENIPFSASMASFTTKKQNTYRNPTPRPVLKPSPSKKKAKSRLGISKSRPFNVFSNLTASLSRTSLGQLTGRESRRASTSSKGTVRKDPAPYMNSQSASSTSSQALANPTIEAPNSRYIHTAQSSAYWAGRFMALQDRFQSEMLVPENLTTLVHAHAVRSFLPVVQPSLASSATTGCIMPAARPKPKPTRLAAEPTSPRKRQQKPESRAAPLSIRRSGTTTVAPAQSSYETAAALLVDEDNRCRRIFSHLDALCTTSEARLSLQQWQQAYARRTGKEHLFTMQRKTRELTWVGRLLIGTGGGHSKRGSLGL
ncbi:hypothetical protein E0Z10_g9437 [Xylaria hypoxylon]|uniref:Uncharacterized protein n=1 Tax=Xylaria hypoxylon TaxID=37992 RepID=A0A4Z0YS87_9PEZI|nr:hypothetical protein E0Z10_g9437 [Xylaria hypoxylon]